jgi:hypothetical protein
VIAGQVLFAGITENIANFNNTADIGLHLGVTRAFGSRPRPAGRPGAPSPGETR